MSEKKLIIKKEWCKGCGICAAFCPKKALSLVNGKAVCDEGLCVLCGLCELRCPDYAIYIDKPQKEAPQWVKPY